MDLETAVKGIYDCRERIHKQHMWNDPMALSDVMTKLAVYNSYLADNLAILHKEATDKAHKVYLEKRKSGETASYSEQASRGESTDERMLFENTQNIYKATRELVSILQSRLVTIREGLKQEDINV